MARPARIDVIGDSASATRALEQTAVAVGTVDTELKKLTVDAEASARAMVAASTQRISRLEAEAVAARQLSTTYVQGSKEQAAAAELAAKRTNQANRLLGVSAAAAAPSALATAGVIGRGLTTYVTAPAAFVGYEAVKDAIDFNKQMLLIQTQAGASAAEVRTLTGEVLKLGPAVGMGPSQLAEGLYHLESIGLRGSQALETLRISAFAAGQGIANLEDVTTALGGVVVTGIKGAENYQEAMNTLTATVGAGNMRFEDLAGAIGNVAPAAAAAGVTLPELGAAMATLTDRGFAADEAATRLRMSLALIQSPSLKAQKALADMGVNALSLGATLRQPNGLLTVLQTLHDAVERVGATRGNRDLLAGFGGGRSGLGIQTLVQSLDSPLSSYDQKLQQVAADEQKAAAAHQAYLNSPSFKLHQDLAQVQADLVKIGASLTPIALDAAKVGAGIADAFNALPGPLKTDIGVIVGLLAVGGPLMLAGVGVSKMVKGIGDAFRLIPAEAGPALATTEGEVAVLGTTATTATGEVSALRGGLAGLAGLGPIAIPITIAISYEIEKGFNAAKGRSFGVKVTSGAAQLGSFLGKEFPGLGAVSNLEKAIIAATSPAARATPQPVQTGANNPFEPGGSLNPSTGLTGNQPVGDAFKKAAEAYLRSHPGAAGGGSIAKFALPYQLDLEQKRAALTKSTTDDIQAARDVVAYAKKQIDSGHLTHAAMLQALDAEGAALTTLWSDQKKTATSATASITKDQLLAKARLDLAQGDTASAHTLLEQDKARLEEELKQAKTADMRLAVTRQLTTVENLLKSKSDSFALSLSLQAQMARADAIAALDPSGSGSTTLQIKLAKEAKAAAMKAIDSHTLTLKGLIAAWQIVGQENSVLAQTMTGAVNTYHAVSTRALTDGLGLSRDARIALEERLAQSAAHRGYAPNQIGASPGTAAGVHIDTVNVHGVQDVEHLMWELDRASRQHGQRRGQR